MGTIEAVVPEVRSLVPSRPTESSESVVEHWFLVGGLEPIPQRRRAIAVYTHQWGGYTESCAYLEQLPAEDLATVDAAALADGCFAACAAPPPSVGDLGPLIDYFRAWGGRPAVYGPEGRLACDPRTVAQRIAERDLGERARRELVGRRYTPLAQALYPTHHDYWAAVNEALYALRQPGEAA